jgi:hypothetical protein
MAVALSREWINIGSGATRYVGTPVVVVDGGGNPPPPPPPPPPPSGTKPRNQLVLGVDKPGPGLCGLVDESKLVTATQYTFTSADSGTPAAPTIVKDKRFNRKISLNGVTDIVFENCDVRGEPSTAVECVTATNAANRRIVFRDTRFKPQNPMYRTSAISGHNIELLRCEVSHCIDGFAQRNSGGYNIDQNISIKQTWFHDMWYASPDADAAGGWPDNASHTDVVWQIRGGNNFYCGGNTVDAILSTDETYGTQITSHTDLTPLRKGSDAGRMSLDQYDAASGQWRHLRGNKYYDWKRTARNADGTGNQIIQPPTLLYPDPRHYLQALSIWMMSPGLGPLNNLVIEKNWVETMGSGGANFNSSIYPDVYPVSGIIIRDNRWGRPDGYWLRNPDKCIVLAKSTMSITMTGNIRVDGITDASFIGATPWNVRQNG